MADKGKNQTKSKKRIADHGEVFTSDREVNAMLDLVKQETERIESRFLEPACGTGNFLVEIFRRKLEIVESRYKKNQLEYERYAVLAISSIYGIDLLQDNVEEARNRLFEIIEKQYTELFRKTYKEECLNSIKFILERNILRGDALTLKADNDEPIIFSEWSLAKGSMLKRRDYTMAHLLESQPIDEPNLFSDLGDNAFIPTPVKEFKLVHFLKVGENV
ncbi:MAG: restriction endonuclease subunit M [Tenericutes bacterium 4572_104]|nr:MAG: restriction endonuclease subunit M [Tenericutes bacterium 4572_104]